MTLVFIRTSEKRNNRVLSHVVLKQAGKDEAVDLVLTLLDVINFTCFPITRTYDTYINPNFRLILPLCACHSCMFEIVQLVFNVFWRDPNYRVCCVYFAGLIWYSTSLLAAADTNLLCGGLSSLAQDLLTPSFTVVAGSQAGSTSWSCCHPFCSHLWL